MSAMIISWKLPISRGDQTNVLAWATWQMSCMVSISSYLHLIKNVMTTWIFTKFNYDSLYPFRLVPLALPLHRAAACQSVGRTPLSTLMNIAEVRGVSAVDGIQLNQHENQWHTLTFEKVLIGSSKIQQAAPGLVCEWVCVDRLTHL